MTGSDDNDLETEHPATQVVLYTAENVVVLLLSRNQVWSEIFAACKLCRHCTFQLYQLIYLQ